MVGISNCWSVCFSSLYSFSILHSYLMKNENVLNYRFQPSQCFGDHSVFPSICITWADVGKNISGLLLRFFKQSNSVTCFVKGFSICQNILNRIYCMRCHSDLKQVFVLLRGGESHCIWQRLSLAQLSLQSGFQWREKCQHAACDNSSNQTHISSALVVGILHI